MTDREQVEAILGYQLRAGYDVQTGAETSAPSVVWADADYEVGDGTCGLHETQKPANEPAIPYIRFDTLRALLCERDAAEALALERAATRCEEMQKSVDDLNETYEKERLPGYCVDPDGRDCAAQIRALASNPNALEEHDALVRAEERELSMPVASALVAAISLLEHGGKKAAPSDKMFEQMLTDYRRALEDYRAAIREQAK